MKFNFKNLIFLSIFVGCNSANNLSQKEFSFSTESFNYPWRKTVYNSDLNQYVYKITSEPNKMVTITLSDSEKDSLQKIFRTNFCQCIKSYDEESKITYIRVHRLTYKNKTSQKKCDTINADPNLTNTSEFKYFSKFRQILTSKSNYQFAFPEEYEIY